MAVMPLGEWLPDIPALNSPGLVDVVNAVFTASGWRSLPQPMLFDPLPITVTEGDRPRRLIGARNSSGLVQTFALTGKQAFLRAAGPTWRDVTKGEPGATYNCADKDSWSSTTFGDLLIISNINDPIQVASIGAGTDFADLDGTNAPKAKYICTIADEFVMAGNLDDPDDGFIPYRVRWSQFANPSNWAYDRRFQSDFQDLFDRGDVTGLTGGTYGTALLEKGIKRITYAGSPDIFNFADVLGAQGCTLPQTVVQHGAVTYYCAQDGWQAFDGNKVTPIGAGRIDQWFMRTLDQSSAHLIAACSDPAAALVFWLFPGPGHVSGAAPNVMLIFNTKTQRWSKADVAGWTVGTYATPGMTLEDFDALFATLDDIPGSFDDPLWSSGAEQTAILTDAGLAAMNGPPMPAAFTTGETLNPGGVRTSALGMRVLCEAPKENITLSVGKRNATGDNVIWSPTYIPNRMGVIKPRRVGRYLRYKIGLGGAWATADAIDVDVKGDGLR